MDKDKIMAELQIMKRAMDNIVTLLQGNNSPQKQQVLDDGKPFTNNSLMPFGKYAGFKLKDLPSDYLNWMCEQPQMKHKRLNDWLEKYKKKGKLTDDENYEAPVDEDVPF